MENMILYDVSGTPYTYIDIPQMYLGLGPRSIRTKPKLPSICEYNL